MYYSSGRNRPRVASLQIGTPHSCGGRMSEVRVGCGGDFLIGRWSPSHHAFPLPTEDSTPTVGPTLPTSWQPDPLSKSS